jgi:hypothetical protein
MVALTNALTIISFKTVSVSDALLDALAAQPQDNVPDATMVLKCSRI